MTTRAARLAAARRAGFTGRDLILATMDEETWTDHVVGWARAGSWCGVHLRASHVGRRGSGVNWSALRGIHVGRHHEHDDSFGLPDWFFWRIGRWFAEESKDAEVGETFYVELKAWGEKPTKDQVRVISALRAAGHEVYVWSPMDSDVAQTRFMAAPWAPRFEGKSGPVSQATVGVDNLVRKVQREILEKRLGISLGPDVHVDAH